MKYKISINKPCQENWNGMSPTEQGAFCAVCKKDVVDFTSLPASLFKNKLKNNSCGRFTTEQLAQEYDLSESSRFSRVAAAVGFTALLAGTGAAQAQTETPKTEQSGNKSSSKIEEHKQTGTAIDNSLVVKGKIVDINNEGIFGATIQLMHSNTGVSADFEGNYSISISSELRAKTDTLIISSHGYSQKKISISDAQNSAVILKVDPEAIVIKYGGYHIRRSFFGRLFNIFRKKENRY